MNYNKKLCKNQYISQGLRTAGKEGRDMQRGSHGGEHGRDTFQTLHIFIGIAALGMVFYRPKREELETLVLAMQREVG